MAETVKWKYIAPANIKPEIAANELKRIFKDHGYLTPALIVKVARKKKNPLHDCFEWNDTVAANLYRETQAKYILRQIETEFDDGGDEPIRIRLFHSVVENDKNVYTTIHHAKNNAELWEQIVEKALLEVKNWRRVYKDITRFDAIHAAIDGVK